MVKVKASFLLAALLFLAGCAARGVVDLHPEIRTIAEGVPGRFLSLALDADTLVAAFPDKASTTLKLLRIPLGEHLPAEIPAASVVDKVDFAPPLSPTFGEHALAVRDGVVTLLYQDRETNKLVLKLASKSRDAAAWSLDVVEPAGDPVAVLPGASGSGDIFWAAGSLLTRPGAGTGSTELLGPFHLAERASPFGQGGFTVADADSGQLFAVQAGAAGYEARIIPEAGPVHSSLMTAEGVLAVLWWDARARRLRLLEQQPGALRVTRTTVTLCDGTGTVALLPARTRSSYLFLFDEARRLNGGRVLRALSLIGPGSLLGVAGQRYRKATLLSGEDPIEGFAAVETPRALYVLALQGSLKLLRVPLS